MIRNLGILFIRKIFFITTPSAPVRANVRFGLTDNHALGSPVSETAAGQSNGMVEAETTRDLLGG